MENKLRYLYQFSLANGKVILDEREGFFLGLNQENPEDKTLINSMTLLKVWEVQEEAQPVEPSAQVVSESVEVSAVSE